MNGSPNRKDKPVLGEVSGKDRLEALQTHQSYLKLRLQTQWDDASVSADLARTEKLISDMYAISNDPRGHWVEVDRSRVVMNGSVGKVVYANLDRGHCRVEFGNGERVSCGFGNVTVIDWEPLPAFIPMVGERVQNFTNGQELVAVEWMASEVRVQPPGVNEDTFRLDRQYVIRTAKFVNM